MVFEASSGGAFGRQSGFDFVLSRDFLGENGNQQVLSDDVKAADAIK